MRLEITRKTDLATRAMIALARVGTKTKASLLAEAVGTTTGFLSQVMTPFVGGESTYYLSINRNKRSITLDLRHPDCAEIMRAMVAQSDIVIENFVPGHMQKYGFDYDACTEIKPDIIYCSISGFGQNGPDHGRAAYDQVIQGL